MRPDLVGRRELLLFSPNTQFITFIEFFDCPELILLKDNQNYYVAQHIDWDEFEDRWMVSQTNIVKVLAYMGGFVNKVNLMIKPGLDVFFLEFDKRTEGTMTVTSLSSNEIPDKYIKALGSKRFNTRQEYESDEFSENLLDKLTSVTI